MVRTRSRAQGHLFASLSQEERLQVEERAREQEQQHSQNSYTFDNDFHMPDDAPSYRHTDACKRHRKPDNAPYTEVVSSYRRRKA